MTDASPSARANHVSLLWATREHVAGITSLQARLFDEPWQARALVEHLTLPAALGLVATVGAPPEVVGFVLVQVAADEAEILTLGVAPDRQRCGIGGRLVDGAGRAARRMGARALHLEVAATNTAALALYRSKSFAETGRRKDYYVRSDGRADALLMCQRLDAPSSG
jgi:ribosomal-protein-alanine N-acetyltransferase